MKIKHCVTALLLMAIINCTPVVVHAQDIGDPDDPLDTDTHVPIDGGVTILVAAGVVYGLKKKYEQKKQSPEKQMC